uniref:Transmembrane protein n=1 Tax=Macrostomum lignano TaxID=282301 RepID=A0A1I8FMR6_9PLAT
VTGCFPLFALIPLRLIRPGRLALYLAAQELSISSGLFVEGKSPALRLPRRVLVRHPRCPQAVLSDYSFPGETSQDVLDRLAYFFSTDLSPEDVNFGPEAESNSAASSRDEMSADEAEMMMEGVDRGGTDSGGDGDRRAPMPAKVLADADWPRHSLLLCTGCSASEVHIQACTRHSSQHIREYAELLCITAEPVSLTALESGRGPADLQEEEHCPRQTEEEQNEEDQIATLCLLLSASCSSRVVQLASDSVWPRCMQEQPLEIAVTARRTLSQMRGPEIRIITVPVAESMEAATLQPGRWLCRFNWPYVGGLAFALIFWRAAPAILGLFHCYLAL